MGRAFGRFGQWPDFERAYLFRGSALLLRKGLQSRYTNKETKVCTVDAHIRQVFITTCFFFSSRVPGVFQCTSCSMGAPSLYSGEFHLGYQKSSLQSISWYELVHWEHLREAQSKHRLSKQLRILCRMVLITCSWESSRCGTRYICQPEESRHTPCHERGDLFYAFLWVVFRLSLSFLKV